MYYDQRAGTIVGVLADVKNYGLEAKVQSVEYHSVLQNPEEMEGNLELVVRTAGNPLSWAPAVRQQVWTINANIPVVDVMSMEQRLAKSVAHRRFQMLLLGA
ncbi:MAG: hypothetical protein J2P21_30450, partial [Chloracidobacterium sp.]|nr:hypothetical protein [Chloracidobacterium sp.]